MISLKLCDEMELVLEFAFSTFRLNAIPSTSYFKTGKKPKPFTTQVLYFTVPKFKDPVWGLFFANTGSINSGTRERKKMGLDAK